MDVASDVATAVSWISNALVFAVVTDAWEQVRARVVRLFGRGRPDPVAEQLLDATSERIAAAGPRELERVRAEQAGEWTVRLKDLVRVHPDAEPELRALASDIRSMLSPGSVAAFDHSMAALGDISVTGHSGMTGGIVHIEGAPPDPPVPGR